MKRFFKKGIATLAAAVMMLGAPITSGAAGKIDANEQSVLDWIAETHAGKDSVIYSLAEEQFAYTSKKMTKEQAETIKTNLKAADDLRGAKVTASNKAKLFGYVQAAAKAAGGNAIAFSDSKTLEQSVAFVRFDENNSNVITKIYYGTENKKTVFDKTTFVSVDGKKYPVVKGVTVTEDGYNKVDGAMYYLDNDGSYEAVPEVDVTYATHVQSKGDTQAVANGELSGTIGEAKRLEAIKIAVNGNKDLGITYTTHCQTYGWLQWSANNEQSGTSGEGKRLEAIQIKLTGSAAKHYDVYYRVHAQSYGWLNWAKDGEKAGTAGFGKRLEGIQIVVVPKWATFDANGYKYTSSDANAYVEKEGSSSEAPETAVPTVMYKTHVQTHGWQDWVVNGALAGTTGEAKRLEGINIKLTNKDCEGGIEYRTHVQTYGWETAFKADGAMSGTSGEAKRLEAIEIKLTGAMAEKYDVYYRVHAQSYGWLNWAKNGEQSGTAGLGKRLEAIQIVVVPKGEPAPAATYNGITSAQTAAFIQN